MLGGSAQGLICMDGGNPVESCQPSNTRGSGSWLHTVDWIKSGNRQIQETCMVLWHCGESSGFADSETETCMESCIIHFPTAPPCSTKVDVLETGDVPILISLPQMKKLGMTIEQDSKGDKITCPAFGLYSFLSS